MKNTKNPWAGTQGSRKNSICNIILPSLNADEQIEYYSAKHAEAEQARLVAGSIQRHLAIVCEQLDSVRLKRLYGSLIETSRFLGWDGEGL